MIWLLFINKVNVLKRTYRRKCVCAFADVPVTKFTFKFTEWLRRYENYL